MTQLTKAQRLKGYEYTLEYFEKTPPTGAGICYCLWCYLVDIMGISLTTRKELDYFPEFAAKMPEAMDKDRMWWPLTQEGHGERIRILKECIQQVNNQPDDGEQSTSSITT